MTRTARSLSALVLMLSLSACSISVNAGSTTEPADKVAGVAMDALESEVGQRPDELDCGDDDITIEDGTEVDCVLTHQGVSFDATVTIDDVEGSDYTVNVQVADTPRSSSEEDPS
ncbi:DUF4333 domain-containing protein [Aeromicrobium camelliae]|uniref:DUF4333 domain-containing protein n=1 Tax=Aeromicrobium camelliae TaxID=1538144 RepID=A0A3N6WME1_9ACTN|nr:DUF4333 domain-containing protein [Aeromicrobium camelliae]RQN08736.1 DUF4333 domain-containing protein [Aeromicrobium camelliae]